MQLLTAGQLLPDGLVVATARGPGSHETTTCVGRDLHDLLSRPGVWRPLVTVSSIAPLGAAHYVTHRAHCVTHRAHCGTLRHTASHYVTAAAHYSTPWQFVDAATQHVNSYKTSSPASDTDSAAKLWDGML